MDFLFISPSSQFQCCRNDMRLLEKVGLNLSNIEFGEKGGNVKKVSMYYVQDCRLVHQNSCFESFNEILGIDLKRSLFF